MLVRHFDWITEDDPDHEVQGWLLRGADERFDPGPALAVAHDTLEHFTVGYDGWEDELLAFGAMTFIRGETGWFGSNSLNLTAGEIMAGDISDCYRFFDSPYERNIREIPRTRRVVCEDAEETIREIARKAKLSFLRWEDPESPEYAHHVEKMIIEWLKKGYRKARKRFYGNSCYAVSLFDEIMRQVEHVQKWADYDCSIKVSVNLKRAIADVTLIEPTYDKYY